MCAPAGHELTSQPPEAPQSCRALVCDGRGGLEWATDVSNRPLHGPCEGVACIPAGGAGTPSFATDGTSCGNGLVCRGDGGRSFNAQEITECVGCAVPSDCVSALDPETHPCIVPTCDVGVCREAFVPSATSCSDAGGACDGIGSCQAAQP